MNTYGVLQWLIVGIAVGLSLWRVIRLFRPASDRGTGAGCSDCSSCGACEPSSAPAPSSSSSSPGAADREHAVHWHGGGSR